jgi:hypothetical protein
MTNQVGKALVLVTLVLSVVLMTWALILVVQPVDYGWKEPRKVWATSPEGKKEPNERIAAKIDERVAGYEKLREARANAVAWARKAAENLAKANGGFGYNHLHYQREAERLWQAPGTIPFAEIKYNKDGTLALKRTPGKEWDMPIWDQPVPGVDKSYMQYLLDLWKKAKEIEAVSKRIAKGHELQEKLTVRLNGVRGKDGKVVEPGYYDLLELEAEKKKKLREQVEYEQPLWVVELFNAQYLRERRQRLEKRLIELGEDPSRIQLK